MEESVYILHEGKRPFIIFIHARRLDVPGEDNKCGGQSQDWSHYWEAAGAITSVISDGKGGKLFSFSHMSYY